jgi:hypothetical protein
MSNVPQVRVQLQLVPALLFAHLEQVAQEQHRQHLVLMNL